MDGALRWQRRAAADTLALLLLFAVLFAAGLRRFPLVYTLYAAPQLAPIAVRTSGIALASTGRYVLVLFPVFVLLGLLGRRRRFHQLWLIGSVLFLGLFLYAFLSGRFIA